MLKALLTERTLNKNGNLFSYFLLISGDIKAWLSCTISRRDRPVSRSFDGSDGCVPIHSFNRVNSKIFVICAIGLYLSVWLVLSNCESI